MNRDKIFRNLSEGTHYTHEQISRIVSMNRFDEVSWSIEDVLLVPIIKRQKLKRNELSKMVNIFTSEKFHINSHPYKIYLAHILVKYQKENLTKLELQKLDKI